MTDMLTTDTDGKTVYRLTVDGEVKEFSGETQLWEYVHEWQIDHGTAVVVKDGKIVGALKIFTVIR